MNSVSMNSKPTSFSCRKILLFLNPYKEALRHPMRTTVKLNKILRAIGGNRKKHIVCGDTNFRDIDWDNCTTDHDEYSKERQ